MSNNRSSVASRFMNTLSSPSLRPSSTMASASSKSSKKKRPQKVTPTPWSQQQAKRPRIATPKTLVLTDIKAPKVAARSLIVAKKEPAPVKRRKKPAPVSSELARNFFKSVHFLVCDSTARNSPLIHWVDNGASFVYNDNDTAKMTAWLKNYFPSTCRCCCCYLLQCLVILLSGDCLSHSFLSSCFYRHQKVSVVSPPPQLVRLETNQG